MNKVNFLNKDNFPLYSEGLAKLQNAIFMTANFALLGGQRYILSGCIEDKSGNVSDGLIVINGELMEFIGGAKKEKIIIREIKTPLTAFGVEYPESYVTRYAEFSATGDLVWSDFEKIPTNQELYKQIKDIKGDPAGIIKEWAGMIGKIPKDYMLCDGRDLSISEYPELYEAIGVTFGGDGLTTFKLPDARGRFSVSYSGNGDYSAIGKIGGEEFHKLTINETPIHDHTDREKTSFNKLSARAADIDATNTPTGVDSGAADAEYRIGGMTLPQWQEATIKKVGGDQPHENRPPYIVFAKIIKIR